VARSFRENVEDFEANPEQWQPISVHTDKASRKGARRQGVSTQTIYRHRVSKETLVRHTVIDDRGQIVDDHFRPDYKPRWDDLHEKT
jgi:hypothetical protein